MISDRSHRLFYEDIIGGNSEGISQKIDRGIPGELSERSSVWISTGTSGGYSSRTTGKKNQESLEESRFLMIFLREWKESLHKIVKEYMHEFLM